MHVHATQDTHQMTTPQSCTTSEIPCKRQPVGMPAEVVPEGREERASRLYASDGGPLIGWLFDECRRRGHEYRQMAACLGVTYGYVNQLRNGIRLTRQISDEFAVSCARYLGVPPVVVKMAAGRIPMSDFIQPHESEEDVLNRAMSRMLADPIARTSLPANLDELPLSAKRALVTMYIETSGCDLLGLRHLPEMVRWLQRSATIHDESEAETIRGHRGIAG